MVLLLGRSRIRALASVLACAAGCTGDIAGDLTGPETPVDDAPPRDPGRPPAPNTPIPNLPPPSASLPACKLPVQSDLRRLSGRELVGSIQDLLGVSPSAASLPADPLNARNFDNDPSMLHINDLDADVYFNAFESAVQQAYAGAKSRFACAAGTSAADCRRQGLTRFLRRAYGAPPSNEVLARYEAVLSSESDPIAGEIKMTLAALLSPRFLYTWAAKTSETGGDVTQYLLLQRLTLMLWGSRIPDDEALDMAQRGELAVPGRLKALIDRMLQDPRASRFVSGFFSQWLAITRLELQSLDRKIHPEFSPELMTSMRQETELFFREIVTKKLNVSQIFEATFSFLNSTLASLYGVPSGAVTGGGFTRLGMPSAQRRGIMTQASVLTTTNSKDSTSPVRRSLYYLRTFECLEIPPPPAGLDVDQLASENPPPAGSTVKQGLMHHRSLGQVCSGCHSLIDPMGLAFEPYSSTGKWRDTYPGTNQRVESDWDFEGQPFNGPIQLIDGVLRKKKREEACLTRHLMGYALNTSMPSDETCSSELFGAIPAGEATVDRLVFEIASTPAMKALRRE